MRHRHDAVGMHLAVFVDRDIFAGHETFIGEVKPDLVWHIGAAFVVKRSAASVTMNEMTMIVRPVRPQSRDSACLAMLAPERRIGPLVSIKRRDDEIGDARVAGIEHRPYFK